MRLLVCLLALCALPALAAEEPPPPPPPPPSGDAATPGAEEPPPAPPGEAQPRTNWARPAAFVGFGAAAGVLAMSAVAAAIGSGFNSSYDFRGGAYLMLLSLA